MGSGRAIKAAIRKHGKNNFEKEIIHIFDNEHDMNMKEKELVKIGENCYNLTHGGKGGFSYINSNKLNSGDLNVMKRQNVVEKNKTARRISREKRKEHYDTISIQNLSKTWKSNKGKKRPEHSVLMKQKSTLKQMWLEDRERLRDMISGTYRLTDPDQSEFITNRLGEFCDRRGLSFQTLFAAAKRGTPITKGKAKGWTCTILVQ